MRIGKYNIRADNHQFILEEVKINSTERDGVKGPNYGEEELTKPCYPQTWEAVTNKLIKLEAMTAVNDFKHIQHVAQAFSVNLLKLEDDAIKQIAVFEKMFQLLEKFLPCDEDGNGEGDFVYSDGSESFGKEVIALLVEARGENSEHSN